jgi:hypothetical protein
MTVGRPGWLAPTGLSVLLHTKKYRPDLNLAVAPSLFLPSPLPPISALQVMSWHTWRRDVDGHQLEAAINRAAPGEIRALRVSWRVREAGCETETRRVPPRGFPDTFCLVKTNPLV